MVMVTAVTAIYLNELSFDRWGGSMSGFVIDSVSGLDKHDVLVDLLESGAGHPVATISNENSVGGIKEATLLFGFLGHLNNKLLGCHPRLANSPPPAKRKRHQCI